MVLIDLGESRGEPFPDGSRPATSARSPRWIRLALALVLLAGVAAAGPLPAPLPQVTVPARLGALTVVDGDRLFVVDPGVAARVPDSAVSAYRLPDGDPLWRAPLPVPGPVGSAAMIGGTLVLTGNSDPSAPGDAVGMDARTGGVSWRQPLRYAQATVGGDLLVWDLADGRLAGNERSWSVWTVDARSGRRRWSIRFPAGARLAYHYVGESVDTIVVGLRSGVVEVRDVRDGRVLRSADLPPPDPAADVGAFEVTGDLLITQSGPGSISAYGLDRFDRKWTVRAEVGFDLPLPVPCGPVLCRFGRSGGVRALDPATGRTLWSDPRWAVVSPLGDRLVAAGPGQVPGESTLMVLDPRDGRVLGDLGRWELLRDSPSGGARIGVRADPGARRALVAVLDTQRAEVRILAVLPGSSSRCEISGSVIVCRRLDASVGVWRLPG